MGKIESGISTNGKEIGMGKRRFVKAIGRKVSPGLPWMAVAALLALAPAGATVAENPGPADSVSSPSQAALHVRKSGGDSESHLVARKAGGEKPELAMRNAGGAKDIIAIYQRRWAL